MANFFLTTLVSLSGTLLCQTRLLLGFTRHYIDIGYCNSVILSSLVGSCQNKVGI